MNQKPTPIRIAHFDRSNMASILSSGGSWAGMAAACGGRCPEKAERWLKVIDRARRAVEASEFITLAAARNLAPALRHAGKFIAAAEGKQSKDKLDTAMRLAEQVEAAVKASA